MDGETVNVIGTGGENGLDGNNGGDGGWFIDNSDRAIWHRRGGRLVNVWNEYVDMLGVIRQFLFGGEFLSNGEYDKCRNGKNVKEISYAVNKYVRKVYGYGFGEVYNKVHGRSVHMSVSLSDVFQALINYYGLEDLDWLYLFKNTRCFVSNNVDISMCIAKQITRGGIYHYFNDVYNFKVVGMGINNTSRKDSGNRNVVYAEWDGGRKQCDLSDLVIDKSHAWQVMTGKVVDRGSIRDYGVFLGGRDEDVMMPDRCPVFNNIVLNYTGIDFSGGLKNKKACSLAVYEGSKEVTWSSASIDRIDSNRGYSYDNIRVISDFANGLKNCYSEYHFECMLQYFRNTRAVI